MVNATLVVAWSADDPAELPVSYAVGDGTSAVRGTHAAEDSIVAEVARSGACGHRSRFRRPTSGSGVSCPTRAWGRDCSSRSTAAGETFGVIGVMMAPVASRCSRTRPTCSRRSAMQAAASFAHARARREVEQLACRVRARTHRPRPSRHRHPAPVRGRACRSKRRAADPPPRPRNGCAKPSPTSTTRSDRSGRRSSASRPAPTRRADSRTACSTWSPRRPRCSGSSRRSGSTDRSTPSRPKRSPNNLVADARAKRSRTSPGTRTRRRSTVTVSAGEDIVLIVDDDGVGADNFHRDGGHGVANLHERARSARRERVDHRAVAARNSRRVARALPRLAQSRARADDLTSDGVRRARRVEHDGAGPRGERRAQLGRDRRRRVRSVTADCAPAPAARSSAIARRDVAHEGRSSRLAVSAASVFGSRLCVVALLHDASRITLLPRPSAARARSSSAA